MRPQDIKVGVTYCNRGKGTTRRTVLEISDKLDAPWFSSNERPSEPVVRYMQDDKEETLYLSSFAAWCGRPADESSDGCQSRLVSRYSVSNHFARYKAAREWQHNVALRRGSLFGIAVGKDELALEWQAQSRTVEESEAFLEDRQPIPERWGENSSITSTQEPDDE